ncbi:DoxX family membrane protein [Flavobacteriaceae bacterium AH-315-B10]|nr:DoxX family membrane protein [Flavobacteriaceae bacterium AH-315-B10]
MQRNRQIAMLSLRLLLGFIFFFQGFGKIFKFGLENVYEKNFLSSYADLLPEFILRFTSYYTSLAELICGALLIIGLKIDFALYFLASVLIIVTIGHGLKEPIWDLSHVMFRTVLLISILLLPKKWDSISVDSLINKKLKQ